MSNDDPFKNIFLLPGSVYRNSQTKTSVLTGLPLKVPSHFFVQSVVSKTNCPFRLNTLNINY